MYPGLSTQDFFLHVFEVQKKKSINYLDPNVINQFSQKKVYTLNEVAQHNKKGDCWIIIDNNVYDVSKYVSEHPGGSRVVLEVSGEGKDATRNFENTGHSKRARNMLKTFFIGTVEVSK